MTVDGEEVHKVKVEKSRDPEKVEIAEGGSSSD
jgi:hypothetical protein